MKKLVALLAVVVLASGANLGVGFTAGSQDVVVSPQPIFQSPRIMDGRVYSIIEAGDRIVVGGTFTTVRDHDSDVEMPRSRLFSFDPTNGKIDPDFHPTFNIDVNALVEAPDGQSVIVGGAFTTVNGVARQGLVKLNLADGQIDPTFTATTNNAVMDMEPAGSTIVVGGKFRKLSGVTRERLGAIDATTGAISSSLNLPVMDSRDTGAPFIQELAVSPDGESLAIVGNFITVDGQLREQIALIDLTTSPATVADWGTTRYHGDCASVYNSTYLRDVAFSPDSSFLVTVTTGAFRAATLCDTATRWERDAVGTELEPTWTNYTGGDTFWHVIITDAAVYVGGHTRWMNNPNPSPGGDNDGPGSVSRMGIGALDPVSGVPLSWNPTRDRGRGVEAFLATPDYLYVGSDTALFNGVVRQRLAILPTAGGVANPAPDVISLPVEIYAGRTNGTMDRSGFDGVTLGAPTAVSGPAIDGIDWSTARDGFLQKDQLVYYGAAGAYYRRAFDGTTFGSPQTLSTSVGYVDNNAAITPYDQPFNVDTTVTAAYKNGRIFYTRPNDSRLWWRWYSIESGIIGAQEFIASTASFAGAKSFEIAGSWLYAAWDDNKLYRFYVDGATVNAASKTLVDDGATSGRQWSDVRILAFRQASGSGTEPPPPAPPPDVTCANDVWRAEYYGNRSLIPPAATTRCDAVIDNNWGSGAPAGTNVGPDQFSVRWTTTHDVAARSRLTFTATADDGVRVFVDGTAVIDAWRDQGSTTYTGSIDLDPGPHQFKMEYYENGGSAVARLSYTTLVLPDPPDVAIVTDDPVSPPTGDLALRDHLDAAGYDVDFVSDATFDSAAAAPYEVVWISGNARPAQLGTRLTDLAKPMVLLRATAYGAFKLTTSATTTKTDSVLIDDPSHPLAASLTGTQVVTTKQSTLGIGTPAAAAAVVASIGGVPAIFAYEPGEALTDSTSAAGCRAALPYHFNTATSLTSAGWSFVDAAMSWSLSTTCS